MAAATAAAIGVLVVVGWMANLPLLTSITSDWATLKGNTAVGLILCSIALWSTAAGVRGPWGRMCAVAAALLGGLTLAEYLFGLDLRIDEMLFAQPLGPHDAAAGRMSRATALSFVLLGVALALSGASKRVWVVLRSYFVTVVAAVAGAALVGYLYDAQTLFAFVPFESMAVHTALAFLALALGFHAARPQGALQLLLAREDVGGMALRWLLPAALTVPVVIGWLALQGQRADWYGAAMALALACVGMSGALLALLFPLARALGRAGAKRKHALEALRETEERFRRLADAMPQVVWTARPDGSVDYFNQRADELDGLSKSADGTWRWEPVVHPDDLAATAGAWESAVRSGDAYAIEHRARMRDGSWRWYLTRAVPYRDSSGYIVKWFGTGTDVQPLKETEQMLRNTEAQLRDLASALEQRVEARTHDLTMLQRRLRALVAEMTLTERRERQRLAKELHDYLAQLLTAAKIRVGAAVQSASDERLTTSLRAAATALDEAIAYARSLVAELSPVVLYDLGLVPALRWLAEQMGRHGLQVELEPCATEPSLSQDEGIIVYECVRELLWNAVKHAGTDRATIRLTMEPSHFAITVTDAGRGFDPQGLQDAEAGPEHFGLFSVRERLHAHGAELQLVSAVGQGTRATIRLPLREMQSPVLRTA